MWIEKYGLYFAWLFSCIGMLGSLYLSEMRHLEPCVLCWWQRIALYPLVIILGVAAYKGFLNVAICVLPITILGLVIALYQISIQEIPGWNPIEICGSGPHCSEKVDIGLGPVTIPMLSAANFVILSLFLLFTWIREKKSRSTSM